jgi:hypothetical protein
VGRAGRGDLSRTASSYTQHNRGYCHTAGGRCGRGSGIARILDRSAQFLLILERNAVKFQVFEITGIGTFVGEIEASYWYAGLRIGFGLAF